MIINYQELQKIMKGVSIPKPNGGALSGHMVGEPFDKKVYSEIKKLFPSNTFRQYEYLNSLFSGNLDKKTAEERNKLFDSSVVEFLLSRGKSATEQWSLKNQFDEKQNDTTDILIVKDNFYELIDVKTRNSSKSAQPPNIISAYKLAKLCEIMIDNQEFDKISINYFGIDWVLKNNELICTNTYFADLFKSNPADLYINWAAAMQIQFHVHKVPQDYKNTTQEWSKAYLKHFVSSAKERAEDMIDKFVTPFEKHI